MTVNVVLITHEDIGTSLLQAVNQTFNEVPLPTTSVAVSYEADPDDLANRLQRLANTLEAEDGILVLTDMYGATPHNIASALQSAGATKVITGLNLPMLIRIMNYPELSLCELASKAVSGGKEGVIECDDQNTD